MDKEKILSQIIGYLESIGDTLSTGAQQGFEILVRQQFMNGIVTSAILSLAIIVVIIAIIVIVRLLRKSSVVDKEFAMGAVIAIGSIFTLFLVMILKDYALHILNPEYYAIKDILEVLKGD